ncbi:hypothetical protein [Actinophytocola sp.]|uniref:hypothetical protein n=1 Tax=Actinophytocola sp. TaxID=1872138 RepID=UPI0025C136EB|nr:hypothetical protein [Actinophytocola sp.]
METEPITEQQHAAAVTALANMINRWQTSHPAGPAPDQPDGPAPGQTAGPSR